MSVEKAVYCHDPLVEIDLKNLVASQFDRLLIPTCIQ